MNFLMNKDAFPNAPRSHKSKMAPNPVTTVINLPRRFAVSSLKEIEEHYREKGFVVIQKLISDTIIDNCRKRFDKICSRSVLQGSMTLLRDKEDKCIEIEDIFNDRVFSEYTQNPELLNFVKHVTGKNIMGVRSKLINKPPGALAPCPRQYQAYVPFIPAENSVVCWTAMEPTVRDNGCHYVVPKTHEGILYNTNLAELENVAYKDYLGVHKLDELMPKTSRVTIIMNQGDTLFIHPLLVHGVQPSEDRMPIKAIMCHFASEDMEHFERLGSNKAKLMNKENKL